MKQHKTIFTYSDVNFDVTFNYYEAEKQWFDPIKGEGSPGHPEQIELLSVMHKGDEMIDVMLFSVLENIENELLEQDWNEQE